MKNDCCLQELVWGCTNPDGHWPTASTIGITSSLAGRLSTLRRIFVVGPVFELEIRENVPFCVENHSSPEKPVRTGGFAESGKVAVLFH